MDGISVLRVVRSVHYISVRCQFEKKKKKNTKERGWGRGGVRNRGREGWGEGERKVK